MNKCLTITEGDIDAQIKTAFKNAVDECEYNG